MLTRRASLSVLAAAVVASLVAVVPGTASAAPNGYVRMSDGVLIAVNVRLPDTYVEGRRYPTIFEMSGYDGGSASGQTLMGDLADEAGYEGETPLPREDSRQLTKYFNRHYVTVHASVRGTGCSGGEFDLFSWRSALDGREVIEWIAGQPWSNSRVGIMGHSYGGITGFMVAATRPPHLRAVTVSGLIDDVYRGIVYPGGVSNYGFPLLWTGGIRNAYDVAGGTAPGIVRTQDPVCMQNLATHRRTVLNDPIVQGLSDTDNDWFRARSLVTYAERIRVPTQIAGAYQDEQTGPRFPHLFELLRGVPKRLLLMNGVHGTQQSDFVMAERRRWMDHWMRGLDRGFGSVGEDRSSVLTYVEMREARGGVRPNGVKRSRTFPLEDTRWTNWHLRANGRLTRAGPAAGEGSDSYFSGTSRQGWSYQAGSEAGPPLTTEDGPDELTFRSRPLRKPTAIVGPITATLYVSSTAPETELFVQLIDEGPDGSRSYLQRGLLRASHREYYPAMSDRDGRVLYRPYRAHTNPTPIVPGAIYEYLVEVFPVGHVFRKGHRIVVKVHAPPIVDSYYAYVPRRPPSVNTLYHDAKLRSRIMLPAVGLDGVRLGPRLACGEQVGVRCIPG